MEENVPLEEEAAAEKAQEGGEALSREEVLSRARTENAKNGDERQRSQMQWANYAGFIATEFACFVIMIVYLFLREEYPTELFCILFTGVAAQNIVQACVNRKKTTKIVFAACAALITAATAVYWVLWILRLCGVAV